MTRAILFAGAKRIHCGPLEAVALAAQRRLGEGEPAPLLIFDADTSQPIDLDLRGGPDDLRARFAPIGAETPVSAEPPARGRPKLGVVAREVTLLPRHWDWLSAQRGGASAAIRRLVDEARRQTAGADALRQGQEAVYRFITAMAGDAPGYEAAVRALYAGDRTGFIDLAAAWPTDVRDHALTLAAVAFATTSNSLLDLIPEPRRAAVAEALAAVFPSEIVHGAERMAWGASGAGVFKLDVGDRSVVLRLDGPPDGIRDPARQYACARIAAEAGVAPPLLHADADARLSISGYVAAAPAKPPLTAAEQLRVVTEAVKRLHAAPLFPLLIDYFDAMDGVLAQFSASGVAPVAIMDEALALYRQVAAIYPHDGERVSSHNDLNPSNIILEGARPWIVDWESAFAADAYVDLAAVANFYAADEADEGLVLAAYFGDQLDDRVRARFFLMQQVNRLFYAAMLIGSVAAERPGLTLSADKMITPRFAVLRSDMASLTTADGRLRFGCAFLNEALHHMRSPGFSAALAIVGQGGR
jgi:hypothetical protein